MTLADLTADLRELVAENATAFTWEPTGAVPQDHAGVMSPRVDTKEIEPGGFAGNYEADLYCAMEDFTNGVPAVGDRLRIGSRWLRVVGYELDDFKAGIRFQLASAEN